MWIFIVLRKVDAKGYMANQAKCFVANGGTLKIIKTEMMKSKISIKRNVLKPQPS